MRQIANLSKRVFKRLTKMEQGVALIVSLVIVLALVLLGLSLLMMSSTDQLVSVNEQDATRALGYAETGLDAVNRLVKHFAAASPAPASLTELLAGVDKVSNNADDHYPNLGVYASIGITATFRTLDTTKGITDFTTGNEQTLAGIGTVDGVSYEVFRIGEDTDNDGDWDGPRGHIYVRLDDNYDSDADPEIDTDFRMQVGVIADYPIYVNSGGVMQASNINQRGTARRRLFGRFEPAGRTAIRTDGDLTIAGDLEVCGACGGVHANENLIVGDDPGDALSVCQQASGTMSAEVVIGGTDVRGGVMTQGEVFIPVINPYDNRYVPTPDTFNVADENTYQDYLECPGPDVNDANYLALDPGASKYFALVLRKVSGSSFMDVYKAYWDTTNNHWVWRLVDSSDDSTGLDLELDNCGRVVSGTVRGYVLDADPAPAAGDPYWGAGGRPNWVGVGVDDAGTNEFYDMKPENGNPGNYDLRNPACDADETLTTVDWNDYARTNWDRIKDNTDPFNGDTDLDPPAVLTDCSVGTEDYCTPTLAATDPILPGTVGNSGALPEPNNPTTDGNRDFIYQDALEEGRNTITKKGGQEIYSPLWGSVIFYYGNLDLNGGSEIKYVNTTPAQATADLTTIEDRWRTTSIVFGSIDFSGNPIYGPASPDFQVLYVAGRDIEMSGTVGGGHGNQDQCPDMSPGSDCLAVPGNAAGYEGLIMAHEEINYVGNVTVDGLIIAEDAAECADVQQDGSVVTGSVQVHYDCNNPADPWGNRSVQLTAWEEVQQ